MEDGILAHRNTERLSTASAPKRAGMLQHALEPRSYKSTRGRRTTLRLSGRALEMPLGGLVLRGRALEMPLGGQVLRGMTGCDTTRSTKTQADELRNGWSGEHDQFQKAYMIAARE